MSASLINDPKHWRERAKEARAMADEMKDRQAKQMMLGIARDYVLLAERAEARAKSHPPQSN
jgi:hypothetical protein